ncbi:MULTISPECIES: helix-turn-helix transcriptional regulator [unclassified Minwuia]|jgi:AraC-like DNA-binding protein|uniref:helix-turn-helix domain-containing protein n=1 Tax=unclassified Minwuia TaxID=2618799 RepID=UPI0024786B8C|nr:MULTISPECIES: helix-turn-helix transcriptional regulator [unclassified Minwuia]
MDMPDQPAGDETCPPLPADLRPFLVRWAGFADMAAPPFTHRMPATTFLPLIINFADPYLIHAGHRPGAEAAHHTFTAGLIDRFTVVRSVGPVHCVQVDFTPAGARAFFRIPLTEITGQVVSLADLLGQDGRDIVERLALCGNWPERFRILEQFLRERILPGARQSAAVMQALRAIEASAGTARISRLAQELDISREHLTRRFSAEVGIAPKAYARIVRFENALQQLQDGSDNVAAIAHGTGYADQAHLTREFARMAGTTPGQV